MWRIIIYFQDIFVFENRRRSCSRHLLRFVKGCFLRRGERANSNKTLFRRDYILTETECLFVIFFKRISIVYNRVLNYIIAIFLGYVFVTTLNKKQLIFLNKLFSFIYLFALWSFALLNCYWHFLSGSETRIIPYRPILVIFDTVEVVYINFQPLFCIWHFITILRAFFEPLIVIFGAPPLWKWYVLQACYFPTCPP